MFAGNPNLRDANEPISMEPWQLLEIQKCVRDPIYFANKYVKITTKDDGIQLFKTWDFQSDLIKTMKDNRFVIAKFPRQCGKCFFKNTKLMIRFPSHDIVEMTGIDLFSYISSSFDIDISTLTYTYPIETYTRKFIESYSGGGIEVLSDTGWKPIEKIHKTEVYDIWQVVTTDHALKCADDHILFRETDTGMDEVFAKDLHLGDRIYTENGFEIVVDVYNTYDSDNMYDIELDDENHRYFTDGILSHNSTTTRAFLLWQALFSRDITIAILANKLSLAMEQLQQLKESYAMLPYWMQPGLRQWNKKTVQFSHNTRVMCAATSPDGIRGLSVNILYIDEFAFIPHYIADEFIASIFPTISSGESTKIFITSTPRGMNHFYTMWEGAIKGPSHKDWNKFIPKEIAWNAVPKRDEEWAKTQIRQIGQIRFNQEFLCDFVGSVSTLIDNNFLKTLKPVEPMELAHLPEFLKIWDLPKSRELMEMKGWEYVACLDASYGVRADSSVLKIYLAKSNITLHLVAQMSANDMEIGDFCECANQLLQRYNQPNLIIEMNGPGTAAMEYFHIQAEYENLVHFDPRGKMKGLWAGDKLKNAAVIMLKSYVQRKLVKDYDHDTIAELFSFGKVTKEKWGAMGGNHDDHVMSMLWCIYYVNSPLFYGNISEANIAGMKNPDLILDTDDTIIEEDDAISNLKNPEFHKKELSDAAQYNPYDTDNDSDNSDDRYRVRIIGEDDEEDDQVFYGGFRS